MKAKAGHHHRPKPQAASFDVGFGDRLAVGALFESNIFARIISAIYHFDPKRQLAVSGLRR